MIDVKSKVDDVCTTSSVYPHEDLLENRADVDSNRGILIYSIEVVCIPLNRSKRTANDLLAELNADVIDVESNSGGINIPPDLETDADVLEKIDVNEILEDIPISCGDVPEGKRDSDDQSIFLNVYHSANFDANFSRSSDSINCLFIA